jgi:Phosphotransferase enzyme family
VTPYSAALLALKGAGGQRRQSDPKSRHIKPRTTHVTIMEQIPIPYFASSKDLPADLPSTDAIESATEIFLEQTARKVVGIGPHFIVKYGLAICLEEGRTMVFLKNNTAVPVPQIYALFNSDANGKSYVIMERARGESLDTVWDSMNDVQKEKVASQLRSVLVELRSLPTPGGYCSLGVKPLRDHIFYTGDEEKSQNLEGPFRSEPELNDALIRKYLASGYLPVGKADLYRRSFPTIFYGHPPTFTHGDFQRKNIIMESESGRLSIIDWEFAGWYPSYWEYSRALLGCGRFDDDWSKWVDLILEPYRNEWVWMRMLIVELWS